MFAWWKHIGQYMILPHQQWSNSFDERWHGEISFSLQKLPRQCPGSCSYWERFLIVAFRSKRYHKCQNHLIHIWFTSDSHMIHIWFTSDSHMIVIWLSYDCHMTVVTTSYGWHSLHFLCPGRREPKTGTAGRGNAGLRRPSQGPWGVPIPHPDGSGHWRGDSILVHRLMPCQRQIWPIAMASWTEVQDSAGVFWSHVR